MESIVSPRRTKIKKPRWVTENWRSRDKRWKKRREDSGKQRRYSVHKASLHLPLYLYLYLCTCMSLMPSSLFVSSQLSKKAPECHPHPTPASQWGGGCQPRAASHRSRPVSRWQQEGVTRGQLARATLLHPFFPSPSLSFSLCTQPLDPLPFPPPSFSK